MRNFKDTFKTRKRSFISAFSICMTVHLNISEKDYVFINDKVNRYRKLKEGIRKRIRS